METDQLRTSTTGKILRSLSAISLRTIGSSSRKNSPVDLPSITVTQEESQKQVEQLEFNKSVESLMKGCHLVKVVSGPRFCKRVFFLDPDHCTVFYHEPYGYKYRACRNRLRTVDLHSVKEVRLGYKSDLLMLCSKNPKFLKRYPEDVCFCLILSNGKTISLIAPKVEVCKSWIHVVQHVVDRSQHENREARLEKWLAKHFKLADTSKDGLLNFEECTRLLIHLNLQFSRDVAMKVFQEAGAKSRNAGEAPVLDSAGFHRLYTRLSDRPDLRDLFEEHASLRHAEYWSVEDLQRFLQDVQMEQDLNVEACEFIIKTFEPFEENQQQKRLSLSGFRNYLLHQRQFLFDPEHRQVYQDMTRSLSDYYIASSHNTYLTSNQLTGESSIEAYISCFQNGCRCVEVDCWDGPDGEPIVTHGRTLTSNIFFRDVITVVRDYGFRASPYPVIVSLENHCSRAQQDVMSTHLRTILGDMLYRGSSKEDETKLPSPEALRNRVILKSSKLAIVGRTVSDPESLDSPVPESPIEKEAFAFVKRSSTDNKPENQLQHEKLSALLSEDIFLQNTKFRTKSTKSSSLVRAYQISSLSESKCCLLIAKNRDDLIAHCRKQLLRVYPDGTRTDSTNFDSIPMFRAGCQVVAINYQDKHPETSVYKAFFKDNGGCGYILKPAKLLSETEHKKPSVGELTFRKGSNAPRFGPFTLKVTVISGQQLPKPSGVDAADIADPFVVVQIAGCELDNRKEKTGTVQNNGFSPQWNQTFEFPISEPDFAVFRVEVRDQGSLSSPMIGHNSLPVKCLQQGYRHMELYDKNDLPLEPAAIFLRIQKLYQQA